MAKISVRFPPHLRRFIELPASAEVESETVAQLLDELEARFEGVKIYLVHENGKLRQHVNLFLDGRLLVTENLDDVCLSEARELVIMQALSGG